MTEMKKPEDAVRVIMNALAFLEKSRVKAERPVPITRDRQGKLARDYTLKEWIAKLHEELVELEYELTGCYNLEDKPGHQQPLQNEAKKGVADELCDLIKTGYSMAHQMGMDADYLESEMHNNNVKTKDRGYHDE